MKLTMSIIAALAGLLYLVIKTVWPSFPLSEEVFLTLFVWVLVVLFGLVIEPGIRAGLIKVGLTGFRE